MEQENKLEQAKRIYEEIEIPAELSKRVEKAISQYDDRLNKRTFFSGRKILYRTAGVCAAAGVVLFTLSVNTSTVFAKAVGEIPILGSLARLVTFRSYTEETDAVKMTVEIPSLEIIAADTESLAQEVNQQIHNLCEEYAKEAMQRAEEYRLAFLATGGTQQEWEEHHLEFNVGYDIKAQTEEYLSFSIWGDENWSSAGDTINYYTMDLANMKMLTLEDLLGENYIEIANDCIYKQMKDMEAKGISFFSAEEGGFTGITPDTGFYLNQKGNPVVVFAKYEIAPGAFGPIEFEITDQQSIPEEDVNETYYTDNFSVDKEAVTVFAGKIKEAVAEQDLEALADLMAFPLYFRKQQEGMWITAREDFIALGKEAVFTEELRKSMDESDENDLKPSMAGVVLSGKDLPNIVFGVKEGALRITGMNY